MYHYDQSKWIEYLYWGYLGASFLTAFASVIYLIKLYLFSLEVTTIGDIFLILVLLLATFYFRFNAFHYQELLAKEGVEE
ncbi:hypothetical protein [Carnobacterium divergens]|uniref:Uncharacterized protein n=1 Tax=Carnobacterium divergens TaxID=2748 RepID=A0A2R8A2S0_CARDV|nr:hypothetical protein [Carnobacterium divergens]MCO6016961.1 hypothetical protein [Carnobacterium divergens]MPQ22570.1 hypothetical protein [Carnobacterium divergens]TFI73588.1 hypothetical protein CKN58_06345 [Carnobacterium divergens]TFI77535.1 hypothetical protein CKN85_06340 [Carnobacterium divergens]TFI84298.1 hypothetical protein CKN56_06380 [Carnobacterium divergens]